MDAFIKSLFAGPVTYVSVICIVIFEGLIFGNGYLIEKGFCDVFSFQVMWFIQIKGEFEDKVCRYSTSIVKFTKVMCIKITLYTVDVERNIAIYGNTIVCG